MIKTTFIRFAAALSLAVTAACSGNPGALMPSTDPAARNGAIPVGSYRTILAHAGVTRLFVADTPRNTVVEFSLSDAVPVRRITKNIVQPEGLATDARGNLYVANAGNRTVEEFSATGVLLRTIATANEPYGIAVDAHEDVFVSEPSAGEIVDYSSGGKAIVAARGLSKPLGVSFDEDGNLFGVEATVRAVYEIVHGTGKVVEVLHGIVNPQDVIAVGSGRGEMLYVSSLDAAEVIGIVLGQPSPSRTLRHQLMNPTFMVMTPSGELFVADNSDNVFGYPASGKLANDRLSGFGNPAGLAVDPVTQTRARAAKEIVPVLYCATPGENSIAEYPTDSTKPITTIATGLTVPVGLATGPDGTLYSLNQYNNPALPAQVQEYAYGQTTPKRELAISAKGYAPWAIAVDRKSNVYILWLGDIPGYTFEIAEYPPGSVTPSRTIASKLVQDPVALATDDDDNLFVADETGNAVFRVMPATNTVHRLSLRLLDRPTSVGVTGTGLNQTLYVATTSGVLKFLPGRIYPAQTLNRGGVGLTIAMVTHGSLAGTLFYADAGSEDVVEAYPPYATSNSLPYETIPIGTAQTSPIIAVASPR